MAWDRFGSAGNGHQATVTTRERSETYNYSVSLVVAPSLSTHAGRWGGNPLYRETVLTGSQTTVAALTVVIVVISDRMSLQTHAEDER